MRVIESFVGEILTDVYGENAETVYADSPLLQYLDRKMKAVHGDCKTRRSLANVYAIYSLLHFYVEDFFGDKKKYQKFRGYEYTKLCIVHFDWYVSRIHKPSGWRCNFDSAWSSDDCQQSYYGRQTTDWS